MGKGLIISGGENGLYSVQVVLSRTRITANIARLEDRIIVLAAHKTTSEGELAAMEGEISSLETAAALLTGAELAAALSNLQGKYRERNAKQREVSMLALKISSCQKNIDFLNASVPSDETVSAWCVDLTEDITGNVGTIEIPGERGDLMIQPGHEGNAAYSAARDGQLGPVMEGTPESTFYNLALLPGWQKWMPTYRSGIITALDGDICSVTLDSALSSAQNLDANQAASLSGVPITYMSCNGDAFEAGDHVVVKFTGQNWSSPVVIGFFDNPQPCEAVWIVGPTIYSPAAAYPLSHLNGNYEVECLFNVESSGPYIIAEMGLNINRINPSPDVGGIVLELDSASATGGFTINYSDGASQDIKNLAVSIEDGTWPLVTATIATHDFASEASSPDGKDWSLTVSAVTGQIDATGIMFVGPGDGSDPSDYIYEWTYTLNGFVATLAEHQDPLTYTIAQL